MLLLPTVAWGINFRTEFRRQSHRIERDQARHKGAAFEVAVGPEAVGRHIPYYSAVVVGGHRAADSEVVVGNRLVVVLAARRYPAFAYR